MSGRGNSLAGTSGQTEPAGAATETATETETETATATATPSGAGDGGEPGAAPPLDLRLAVPALAAWLIAWLGPHAGADALMLAGGVGVVAGVGLLAARHARPRALLAAAVLVCAGSSAASTGLHMAGRTSGPVPALAAREATVRIEAVLTDDPRRAARSVPGRELVVVRLRVLEVRAAGRTTRVRAPVVVLTSDPAWLALLPSQRVQTAGRLRPAEPDDDVAAVLSGRGPPLVLGGPSRLQRAAGSLREGLRQAVAPLPERERGLLPGLVVGDVSRLDPQVQAQFRVVGLTHLTAVSGTNVAIVIGAVLLLCRRLGVRLRVAPVLAVVALVAFVVLARPSPSVLRAAVMGVVGLVALSSGTRRAALPALGTAVLVLVLASPPLARTAGFALSVLATAGILLLAPSWRRGLRRVLPGPLADALAIPAAAQLACGPVIVAISAQLGVLSVPANLLAVPAVAPATLAGVAAALLAPVSMPAAHAAAWVGWLPTAWLVLVARLGAAVPGTVLPWPDGMPGGLLLAALSAVVLAAIHVRSTRRVVAAGATGALIVTVGMALLRPAWPPPGWLLVACDVGQGDALVVRTGPGAALVVDTGPDPDAVDACLRRLGVRQIPLVLLTHDHADHVDGLPGVLRGRSVALVQVGPLDEPATQLADVLLEARAAGVPVGRPGLAEDRSAGQVSWQVLAPTRRYRGTRSDPNNSSLVLRLHLPTGARVLLTGDIEPEAQRDLLARGLDVRADVLKVPHHGSDHQEPAFLDAVGARLVLTSVGADNTYGHPSAATLGRLVKDGATSLRTDQAGDIALVNRRGLLVAVTRGP